MRASPRILIASILLVIGLPAMAGDQPAGELSSPPAPPGYAPGAGACTLSASGHTRGDEWGSCIQVTATLSRPPSVGTTAELTVDVLAVVDTDVRVELDLPRSFDWVTAPADLVVTSIADLAPDTGGCVHRATGTTALVAGRPLRLTGTVKALAPGFATLRARAISLATTQSTAAGPPGGDNVYVTVGSTAARSAFGYHPPAGDHAVTTAAPGPIGCA
jgi:hypothetical protein